MSAVHRPGFLDLLDISDQDPTEQMLTLVPNFITSPTRAGLLEHYGPISDDSSPFFLVPTVVSCKLGYGAYIGRCDNCSYCDYRSLPLNG